MKKLFATILAVSLAAVMMFGTCFAEKAITDGINDGNGAASVDAGSGNGKYAYNMAALATAKGGDLDAVRGVRVTFTVADATAGFGGGMAFNSELAGWADTEWGNDGASKPITAVADGDAFTITRTSEEAFYSTAGGYNELVIQTYWGSDLTITKIDALGADGSVLFSTAGAAAGGDGGEQTADAMSIVLFAGVAAVAFVAVVASKKARA